MSRNSYLTKTKHGIYYFRAVIPAHVRARFPNVKREARRSLNTSNRASAERQARILWCELNFAWEASIILMDNIEQQISKFEQYLSAELANELGSDQHKTVQKTVEQLKTRYRWLKDRKRAEEVLSVDDIEPLYRKYLPIYREAAGEAKKIQRQNTLSEALSHFGVGDGVSVQSAQQIVAEAQTDKGPTY